MRKILCSLLLLLACAGILAAQERSATKHYPAHTLIGDAELIEEWTESNGKQSTTVYVVDIKAGGSYFIKATTNMQKDSRQTVSADGTIIGLVLSAQTNGWQQCVAGVSGGIQPIVLTPGQHVIRFTVNGNMPPLNDGISLSLGNTHAKLDADWQNFSTNLDRLKAIQPVNTVTDKSVSASTEKVLSNPAGNYEHAIDTAFSYSTFSMLYLTGGVSYTFNTYNSTVDPVLHLFDPNNIATRSWSNDDGGGGYESSVTVNIPATGYYFLLARPYYGGQTGITNIMQNGINHLTNTPISGLRFSTTVRTGDLNYFTAKLGGAGNPPDTRLFTLSSAGGVVTGYNDDYSNSSNGTWAWGLGSRIRKNYSSGSSIVFVCAFNPTRTGVCDVYMGNVNGQLPNTEPANFPLLKTEDAIQSAPSTGTYNCISWSGGITSSWTWPLDAVSSWYVAGNPLGSFDKFYSNTPARFPGAWNYTRSGATSGNAVVDLWKTASAYTHASVTKPGNDHPHGYDWESKPGGLDRQFHPRNALEQPNWYGAVSNYYRPTGTFAKNISGKSFETDADAVAAGVAVYENAKLSSKANDKLNSLLTQTASDINSNFDRLYENWKQTWAANASLSDPYAYCENKEYEALQAYCNKNLNAAMLLVFKKFTGGDHLTSKLLWELTRSRYAPLLDEAKKDILDNSYDERGRFVIHGDHDNGVRYIEKILKQLDIKTLEPIPAAIFTVTTSPNPVKDILTVTVEVKENSRISVSAVSSQTGITRLLQTENTVTRGTHQYRLNIHGFAGAAGDMIIVQVKVNGVLQTMKVLVGN